MIPPTWRPYPETASVTGTLLVGQPLEAPALGRSVELLAWLPPGHRDGRPRRVIYMHDGANLFDEATSYSGEWRVDETLTDLGADVVVVGIPNAGDDRNAEYCPWPSLFDSRARGEAYAAFVVGSVMPRVEATLPVAAGRWSTGVMGSSLGGVISLFLFLRYPDRFGFAGSMSTAAWYTPGLWEFLDGVHPNGGRVYLDVGTGEIRGDPAASDAYVKSHRRLVEWFRSRGYDDRTLLAVEEPGAIHHESAWSRRLPAAIRFFLDDLR